MASIQNQKPQDTKDITFSLLLVVGAIISFLIVFAPVDSIVIGTFLASVVLIGLVTIRQPIWALYGLVFLLPLVSGIERGKLIPQLRPNEPLLLAIAVIFLLSIKKIKLKQRLKVTWLNLGIALYLFFGSIVPLLVYFIRGNEFEFSSLAPFVALWQYFILYILIVTSNITETESKRCLQLLVLAGIVIAVVAILQVIKIEFITSFLLKYYYSEHLKRVAFWGYPRTTSLLANWHGTGVYLSFSALVLLAHHFIGSRLFRNWITGVFLLILLAGMITTTSLTSVVVLVLGTIIILMATKRVRAQWILLFLPLMLLVSSVLFQDQISIQFEKQFSGRDNFLPRSISYRFENWQYQFGPIVKDNWLFGYGPNLPEEVQVPSEDSQFVFTLIKGGVLYTLAFMFFIMVAIRRLWRFWHHAATPQSKALALTGATLFITIVPACFLQSYLTYSGVAEYLWIVLGLSVTLQKRQRIG